MSLEGTESVSQKEKQKELAQSSPWGPELLGPVTRGSRYFLCEWWFLLDTCRSCMHRGIPNQLQPKQKVKPAGWSRRNRNSHIGTPKRVSKRIHKPSGLNSFCHGERFRRWGKTRERHDGPDFVGIQLLFQLLLVAHCGLLVEPKQDEQPTMRVKVTGRICRWLCLTPHQTKHTQKKTSLGWRS